MGSLRHVSDPHRRRRLRRPIAVTAVLLSALVASGPLAVAAPLPPRDVLVAGSGTCFAGKAPDVGCVVAVDYANDWVLAGAGQDAQIMSTGRVATNTRCNGAYYLTRTIVSTLDPVAFERTFRPSKVGETLVASGVKVPVGLYAYDVSGPYDAYGLTALLYRRQIDTSDQKAAGRVAPVYAPVMSPAPKFGPGTMPVDASSSPRWTPPKGVTLKATRKLVVFDTSANPAKQDVAPADGWQDSTAGHGVFVRGIAQTALATGLPLVDITEYDSLVTEASMAMSIENYGLKSGAVANLSAGTTYCSVETTRGIVPMTSVVLPQLVNWAATNKVHIVAAAGNDGSTREFYPAAYGVRPVPLYQLVCTGPADPITGLCLVDRSKSVTSVGSLLTASTTGMVSYAVPAATDRSSFSNYGDWVEAWADGSDLVSDYPDAAYYYCVPTASPASCLSHANSTMSDVTAASAHLGGLVSWSGTSFSTPVVAAWIAGGNAAP
jgi:hypothetical protein